MGKHIYQILSMVLIVFTTIFLAVFSGFCQKLVYGCTKMGSGVSTLSLATIGVTIGMMVSLGFPFFTKIMCAWEKGAANGNGTMILLGLVATIILISSILTITIYDKKINSKTSKPIDTETKLLGIFMNSILFVGIAAGILYTLFMNIVIQAMGPKPVTIMGFTTIPIAILAMVLGIMSMVTFDKNRNVKTNKCDKFSTETPDLSGVGAIFNGKNDPPRVAVLGMTIGAGILILLLGIAMALGAR